MHLSLGVLGPSAPRPRAAFKQKLCSPARGLGHIEATAGPLNGVDEGGQLWAVSCQASPPGLRLRGLMERGPLTWALARSRTLAQGPAAGSKASDRPAGLAAWPALCPFTVCRTRAAEVCAPRKRVAGVQRLTGPLSAPHTAGSKVLEGNVLCSGRCREAFGA